MNLLVNDKPHHFPERTTVLRLLEELKLPSRGIAVEVNQHIVPRQEHAKRELADGDRLEIVSLVGGG